MANKSQFNVNIVNETDIENTGVTIVSGQTVSSTLSCGGTAPMGIFFPQNWTACNVGLIVSKDGVNFYTAANFDGTVFSAASDTAQFLPLLPSIFNSVLYIKISCSVAQASNVEVDFALAPIYKGIN